MTRVKICGITNLHDAVAAVNFGADELGFNFFSGSPRYVPPAMARDMIAKLTGRIAKVGVFVNESLENISAILHETSIDVVQLHGDETADFADQVRRSAQVKVIKAFRISPAFVSDAIQTYRGDAVLLDAYSANERGGTGETFDWRLAREITKLADKVYLAGGLTPDNVSEAVKTVHPYAVDVCSGVESGKGVKDHNKLRLFIERAKEND